MVAQAHALAPTASPALDIEALYAAHAPFLARAIMRLAGDGGHVDDILQETFIIAFRKQASFDPSLAAASTWLYGIAANLCQHHRRGRGRWLALLARVGGAAEAAVAPAASPRGDAELMAKQDAALVHRAIASLAFKQREVFVLYELEELSGAEIAALLRVPIGTVWTRLAKARTQFEAAVRHAHPKEEPT